MLMDYSSYNMYNDADSGITVRVNHSHKVWVANNQKKEVQTKNLHLFPCLLFITYFTSSKTTLTDYQCISTGCCTHVAKTEITIDNQHVTNITTKVQISPQTTKRKHRKNTGNFKN